MKLGRRKAQASNQLALPEVSESVIISVEAGARIPARVLERDSNSLVLAITVPTRPLTAEQLQDLVVEYNNSRGRVRLQGQFALESPDDPDLLRMCEPRSVEVLQQRDYVRIHAARPVLVYTDGNRDRIESFTVDVSGGGLLLAGPATIPIGSEISFRISLAPGEVPVTGTGTVVRVDDMGRRAIAFSSIADLDRRRLVRFIFECQRAERRRGLRDEHDGSR